MDKLQLQETDSRSNDSIYENGEEMESEVEFNLDKDDFKEMEDNDTDDEAALEEPAIFLVTNDQDYELEDKLEIPESTNIIIKIEDDSDDDVPKDCSNCARILNNQVSCNSTNWSIKTAPKDIIEIRTVSGVHLAAFALTIIPNDVIFGPFHGSVIAQGTGEGIWKIKCGKLVSITDTNWMEYVNYATNAASRNIDIFQNENCLYYRTCRQIEKGERLLVFYGSDYTNLENNETYYRPTVKETLLITFACTYCCISFLWHGHLIEHKKSCPYHCIKHIKQFVLCAYCKLYIEKTEHDEYHLPYCTEKQKRKIVPFAVSNVQRKQVIKQKYKYDCPKLDCEYKTNFWGELQKHRFENHRKDGFARYTKSEEPYQCKDCDFRSKTLYILTRHTLRAHNSEKHKCPNCTFETCNAVMFKNHLRTHDENESEVLVINCSENNQEENVIKIEMLETNFNQNNLGNSLQLP